MTDSDPYGLPRFPGEESLEDWTDHSEIALRTVRVFTRGRSTATLIKHPALWDLILTDGTGSVEYSLLRTEEIAHALRSIGRVADED